MEKTFKLQFKSKAWQKLTTVRFGSLAPCFTYWELAGANLGSHRVMTADYKGMGSMPGTLFKGNIYRELGYLGNGKEN